MFHYQTANGDIINHHMALHLQVDRNIPAAIIISTARLNPEASWWDCGRNRWSWKEKSGLPYMGGCCYWTFASYSCILVYILLQNTIKLTLLIFHASFLDSYRIVFSLFLHIQSKNKRITCFLCQNSISNY